MIRGALEGMAARLCAEQRDPATIAALEVALDAIRACYAAKDMHGVLTQTTAFYQTLFSRVSRHVAWGVVNLLTVRINHLRSMTIRTRNRDTGGPQQMERIVDAIRRAGPGAVCWGPLQRVERVWLRRPFRHAVPAAHWGGGHRPLGRRTQTVEKGAASSRKQPLCIR